MSEQQTKTKTSITPLLFTTLVISICSMVYELIIGSLSSYLLGDSVKQFSVTIGLYLFSMGIGSFFSKYIEKDIFSTFTLIEILIGFVGGFTSVILFYSYIYTNLYPLFMYLLTIIIGIGVGLEIPLLMRIIEREGESLKNGIANLFAFDYLGGLIGSLAFPILLLPKLGYVSVGFLSGALNLIAASVIVVKYNKKLKRPKLFKALAFFGVLFLSIMIFFGNKIVTELERGLYRDQIILSKQTEYQKIVLTKHKDDLRLFLNGNAQFSSMDEYRYHEALVHVPMLLKPESKNILLLGAGDGLAARELLKYDHVESITIVDLDEKLVEICKTNAQIKLLNQGALEDERVSLIYQDAFVFVQNTDTVYDMIIIDLPDPETETLSKLYSSTFYNITQQALVEGGLVVTQSSSPYYVSKAFWCINKTMKESYPFVLPYHLYVPSFGDWGFNIASNNDFDTEKLLENYNNNGENKKFRYLNSETLSAIFEFANDEIFDISKLETNTLVKPILPTYYQEEVDKW